MVVQLIELAIQLLAVQLPLRTQMPTQVYTQAKLLTTLDMQPTTHLLVTKPHQLLAVQLTDLLELYHTAIVTDNYNKVLLDVQLKDTVGVQIMVQPMLTERDAVFELLMLPMFQLILLQLTRSTPQFK